MNSIFYVSTQKPGVTVRHKILRGSAFPRIGVIGSGGVSGSVQKFCGQDVHALPGSKSYEHDIKSLMLAFMQEAESENVNFFAASCEHNESFEKICGLVEAVMKEDICFLICPFGDPAVLCHIAKLLESAAEEGKKVICFARVQGDDLMPYLEIKSDRIVAVSSRSLICRVPENEIAMAEIFGAAALCAQAAFSPAGTDLSGRILNLRSDNLSVDDNELDRMLLSGICPIVPCGDETEGWESDARIVKAVVSSGESLASVMSADAVMTYLEEEVRELIADALPFGVTPEGLCAFLITRLSKKKKDGLISNFGIPEISRNSENDDCLVAAVSFTVPRKVSRIQLRLNVKI